MRQRDTSHPERTDEIADLSQHYCILKQWAGPFITKALITDNQLSTDDFQGELANQTNLALKGTIAIQNMAVITRVTENIHDAKYYYLLATDYLRSGSAWLCIGISASY
ncbi:hypothetical protein BJ878DRAFT_520993 [Calycina marina]|uniref:Glutaminase A central domain-containing protein n=1 Tax=Calycina marina TaxID=1763456 RepID=A0A9P7YX65_9HELO|nr:hypothetical protein BJ878DRAFT_520993 [Calycina marina]